MIRSCNATRVTGFNVGTAGSASVGCNDLNPSTSQGSLRAAIERLDRFEPRTISLLDASTHVHESLHRTLGDITPEEQLKSHIRRLGGGLHPQGKSIIGSTIVPQDLSLFIVCPWQL